MIPPSVETFLPIKMKNMQNIFPALVSGALLPYPMVVAWKGFHIDLLSLRKFSSNSRLIFHFIDYLEACKFSTRKTEFYRCKPGPSVPAKKNEL